MVLYFVYKQFFKKKLEISNNCNNYIFEKLKFYQISIFELSNIII